MRLSVQWPAEYLPIPFVDRGLTRAGCDCYGLYRLILLEQTGHALPEHPDVAAGETLAKLRNILAAAKSAEWTKVEPGDELGFDVVLMRGQFEAEGRKHSRPIHMGCVVEPGVLIHTEEGAGVTLAPYREHPRIRSRVESFWRLVNAA